MRRALAWLAVIAVLGGGAFWYVTRPAIPVAAPISHQPDADRGALIFALGGCASCHGEVVDKETSTTRMSGGLRLVTEFGTFVAPNISPDPEHGIGGWSQRDFINAMMHGVSPAGQHYYPAFPYTSYARMRVEDVADLQAYIETLPAVAVPSEPHEIGFPFSIRRGLGLWKRLYLSDEPVIEATADAAARGRLLVEGAGHCGECHTPRNAIGGPDLSAWLAGGPNPDGPGRIPNITPHDTALGSWSAEDIAYYLETGFTPDFDSAGGSMASVIKNMALLPPEWRADMAAYLKSVPEVAPE